MTHEEFVESYRAGRITVRASRSLAFRVMNSPLLPLRYRSAWIFWTWVWFLMLPGSIVLGVMYGWWAGILGFFLSTAVLNGTKQSAFQFVLEHAIEDGEFYAKMQKLGMFHVEPKPGQSTQSQRSGEAINPNGSSSQPTSRPPAREHDIGRCEHCTAEFEYWVFSCGMANAAYAYCTDCGLTAVLELYPDKLPKGIEPQKLGPVTHGAEKLLEPCACGGRFRGIADPRCPSCGRAIDPEYAATFIESKSPADKRGWWVRSWHRHSGIIINGHSVRNNWTSTSSTELRDPARAELDRGGVVEIAAPSSERA